MVDDQTLSVHLGLFQDLHILVVGADLAGDSGVEVPAGGTGTEGGIEVEVDLAGSLDFVAFGLE